MRYEPEDMPSEARLRELLVGKSIVSAELRDERPDPHTAGPTGFLTLSDGTVLKVWGNEGGCSCEAGDYPLTNLNGCENVITNVTVEEQPAGYEIACAVCGETGCWTHEDTNGFYRIFVWAEEERVNIASFEGHDGNGHYGTGWWLTVETDTE